MFIKWELLSSRERHYMGWSVGKVAAFRSYLVMLNYLVEKIKLVAKALPTSSIGSEEHEDLHLRSNWMDG